MDANTTGSANVAMGYRTLDANTTGSDNVAIGQAALGANTTASHLHLCSHYQQQQTLQVLTIQL